MAFRYALLFVLPIVLAAMLEQLTGPIQERMAQQAGDWINRALSEDPSVSREAFLSMTDHETLGTISRLDWLFRGCIISGAVIFSLLIPLRVTASSLINLLTAMIIGFAAAKLLVGFNAMRWTEFAPILLIGTIGAFILMLARQWTQRKSI